MKNEMNNFYKAITKNKVDNDYPQSKLWLDYALSTNQRGQEVVEKINEFCNSVSGKKHLDIGCGYGGTCIAFAAAGAESVGIDINIDLLQLAKENLKDNPGLKVKILNIDVMDIEQVISLGDFDIITCDNVIEHVEIPEKLIAHIQLLLSENGIAYLTIPNAFSLGQIIKDCHYGQFGVSLLDPIDGGIYVDQKINQPSYDVSNYYPYAYYEDQIIKYGLRSKLLNVIYDLDEKINDINGKINNINNLLNSLQIDEKISPLLKQKISRNVINLINKLETDLFVYNTSVENRKKLNLGSIILRDYETELWYVVINKKRRNFVKRVVMYLKKLLKFTKL